jgi:hypothetical protein
LVEGGRLGLPDTTVQFAAVSHAVLTDPFQRATPLSLDMVQRPARSVSEACSTQLFVVSLPLLPDKTQALPLFFQSAMSASLLAFNSASS